MQNKQEVRDEKHQHRLHTLLSLMAGPISVKPQTGRSLCNRISSDAELSFSHDTGIHNKQFPSKQAVADLFSAEKEYPWIGTFPTFPGNEAIASTGHINLWADDRIIMSLKHIKGGITGKSVLELGPMECHHTIMLHEGGASQIHSIEGAAPAYVKCLIMKELYDLQRAHIHFGDFNKYLNSPYSNEAVTQKLLPKYDVGVFIGVLYHMINPLQTIRNLANIADALLIWTHYWGDHAAQRGPIPSSDALLQENVTVDGFSTIYYRHFYDVKSKKHIGGVFPYANWLTGTEIKRALRAFGYVHIKKVDGGGCVHPNGCQFTLVASKVPLLF